MIEPISQGTIVASATPLDELVRAFIAPVDLSCLEIERKSVGFSDYPAGLVGVRERDHDRFLTPREYFAIRTYSGPDGTLLSIKKDMEQTSFEWLHASIRVMSGVVSLCHGFPGDGHDVHGSLAFHVPGLLEGYNPVSVLPSGLISVLWGLPYEQLDGNAGLYVIKDNHRRPVARGYGGDYFYLYAFSSQTASRGVRRKCA